MGGVRADAAGDPRRADVGMLEKDDDSDDHPSRERGFADTILPPGLYVTKLTKAVRRMTIRGAREGCRHRRCRGGKRRGRGHSLTLAEGY